jgi:hypothetical protein
MGRRVNVLAGNAPDCRDKHLICSISSYACKVRPSNFLSVVASAKYFLTGSIPVAVQPVRQLRRHSASVPNGIMAAKNQVQKIIAGFCILCRLRKYEPG